jgi:hypothetical protein
MCLHVNARTPIPYSGDIYDFSDEEMSLRDVIRATVCDVNRTAQKIKHNQNNLHYLKRLFDLIVFMRQDDCFCFMEPDRETFIAITLYSLGMTFQDLLETLGRSA